MVSQPLRWFDDEQSDLEAAANQAIAACGGDAREAVKALIVANHFLETELEKLRAATSTGYARGKLLPRAHEQRCRARGHRQRPATKQVILQSHLQFFHVALHHVVDRDRQAAFELDRRRIVVLQALADPGEMMHQRNVEARNSEKTSRVICYQHVLGLYQLLDPLTMNTSAGKRNPRGVLYSLSDANASRFTSFLC